MTEFYRVEVAGDGDIRGSRQAVRQVLHDRSDETRYAAEMVVSELATNALLHGGGRATVTVAAIPGGVRIEVSDGNRRLPVVGGPSPDGMTGRGLRLVSRLAARWGVAPTGGGKVIWAEVVEDPFAPFEPAGDTRPPAWVRPPDARAHEPRVKVSLGQVPTDLLVAAKRHVDNLIREFTLATAGERSRTTAPVPGPLAELIERVVHRFAEARLEMKWQATEAARAGAAHTVLELDLPLSVADAAEEYLDALDEIDRYCRANRLLTLETPPQHRVFRRWYVGEIVKQLAAHRAGRDLPPVMPLEQRLLAEVDAAERARRAAERAARLSAVAVALAASVTAENVALAVLREGVDALGAAGGGVLLPTDTDTLGLPGTVGYDEPTVEKLRSESRHAELPAAYALRTAEPVWLETIEERDRRFPALVGLEPETVAMCAVPLLAAGEVLGALRFSFEERRLFDDDEQRFVLALAAQTAEALQRAQLLKAEREARLRLEHERTSLEKLAAVGEAMLRRGDLDAILQLATDAATQITGAQVGVLMYDAVSPDGQTKARYTLSGVARGLFEHLPMPGTTALLRAQFSAGAIVRLDDITADPPEGLPQHGPTPFGHLPVRSYLALPVTLSTGEVAGGLILGHAEPGQFAETDEKLATGVVGQTAAAIENVRSYQERARVAAILQQSLLPGALPTVEGARIAAVYSAADDGVGGDFYDIFPLGPRQWGIAMGDVRGRGPQAAALTALARYTIRTAAKLLRRPGEVLAVLSDAIYADEDEERFCSAVYAVVDLSGRGATLTYANAGHPPFAVVRPGGVELAPPTGGLAGLFPGMRFSERSTALAPGDAAVLYTDGVSEARRGGRQFGDHRLAVVLESLRGASAQDMAEGITGAARAFAGEAASDDAAVFVLTVD